MILQDPSTTSIHDQGRLVKSPGVLVHATPATRKVFAACQAIVRQSGDHDFTLDASYIASITGLSRTTVYKAVNWLSRVHILIPLEPRRGRGKHSLYRLNWLTVSTAQKCKKEQAKRTCSELTNNSTIKNVNFAADSNKVKNNNILKQSKDGVGGKSFKRKTTEDYQGRKADAVVLFLGSRFYRQVMMAVRLGLETWNLPEGTRHALEGFFGLRIDGASLSYAREIRDKIWAMRFEIEALARRASPKQVCSFVAGRLAGVPERWRCLRFSKRRRGLSSTEEIFRSLEWLDDAEVLARILTFVTTRTSPRPRRSPQWKARLIAWAFDTSVNCD